MKSQNCQSDPDVGDKKFSDGRVRIHRDCHPVRLKFLPRVQESSRFFSRRFHVLLNFFTQLAQWHSGNRLESLGVGALQGPGGRAGVEPRGQALMMV
jgi:hypothetical protein